ncbi:MAG: GNAT family N-acetyltransferase [Planctomycetes bacterium]|nr:GNAT family N-acetyltransferase [Planctomycetota bacterium]
MRSRHVEMSLGEFLRLPRQLGWKHEYYGGKAHITPREILVPVAIEVALRPLDAAQGLEAVSPEAGPALALAFAAAFADAAEFCDFPPSKLRERAEEYVRDYFAGRRGEPLPASRLAREGQQVTGAAFVVRTGEGPLLDCLLVRAERRRRGLATVLVSAAMNDLHARGERRLQSRYHPGNEASAAWHQCFGFVEEPDLYMARLRLSHAAQEIHRRKRIGSLTPAEEARLGAERERLAAEVARLEEASRP